MKCLIIFFSLQTRVDNVTYTKSELDAFKYQFEDNAMDNGAVDKRNKCFCRDRKFCFEF